MAQSTCECIENVNDVPTHASNQTNNIFPRLLLAIASLTFLLYLLGKKTRFLANPIYVHSQSFLFFLIIR